LPLLSGHQHDPTARGQRCDCARHPCAAGCSGQSGRAADRHAAADAARTTRWSGVRGGRSRSAVGVRLVLGVPKPDSGHDCRDRSRRFIVAGDRIRRGNWGHHQAAECCETPPTAIAPPIPRRRLLNRVTIDPDRDGPGRVSCPVGLDLFLTSLPHVQLTSPSTSYG
jgi:hypothetical protein